MIEKIKQMPKVELHLHLDGSVDLETASILSNKKIEEIKDKMVAKDKCYDLNEYLTKFDFPISLMQTKENLKLIAHELGLKLEKQNVIYAEVRFAPMFHTKKGLTINEVIDSVLEGFKSTKVKINLILCLMRGAQEKENKTIIDIAKEYQNKGVCAIDLAGAEGLYPTKDYQNLFKEAKEKGIQFTIHAGEAAGPESINDAINFGAKRIGHGIRCLEDKTIVDKIKDNNILLEICPTSNVQTNVVDKYENHPIIKLYKEGILVCINTDNITVSNISLTEEYIKLYKAFNLTIEDFKTMNINAINHAFITEEEKEKIKKELEKF